MSKKVTRREAVWGIAGGVAAMSVVSGTSGLRAEESKAALKGNIHHSVSRWCYGKISLDDLCLACQRIGIQSVELVGPDTWPTLKKYGLTCAMTAPDWESTKASIERNTTMSWCPDWNAWCRWPPRRACPTSSACQEIAKAWMTTKE